VRDHVVVGIGSGDLMKVSSLRRRAVLAWHTRSQRFAAPVCWMLIAAVEARMPLSKS
jgi:hypothetical protein